MAIPAAYATEEAFALWMHSVLGQLTNMSGYLKWSSPEGSGNAGQYQDAVDEALAVYGVSAITAVTDVHLLHKIGRVELWRLVAERTAAYHDERSTIDGVQIQRSQIHKQAKELMQLAMQRLPASYYTPALTGYAGGTSVGDKESRQADTDRVKPAFTRETHENPSVDSETWRP